MLFSGHKLVSNYTRFPTDAAADQEVFAIGLKLHDLRQWCIQRLADEATCLVKDFIQIVSLKCQLPKLGQCRPLTKKYLHRRHQ